MARVSLFLLFVLAVVGVPPAQASAPVLGAPINLTVRGLPRAVAMADLDGDSHTDLAVACEADSFVTILYGKGGGTFDPPVDVAVGPAPGCLAIVDWNHDGKKDLVVGVAGANPRLRILLGNGGRTFVPSFSTPLAGAGRDLKVADFNGDGLLDLAGVESAQSSDGFIYYGTANGSWGARKTLPGNIGVAREWIAPIHYDANASLDAYVPAVSSDGVFYVQNGSGGFDGITAPPSTADAAVLDFDQDGRDDLLSGGDFAPPATHQLDMYRNTGSGFVLAHSFAAGGAIGAIGTADLDANGTQDAILTRRFGTSIDVVLLSCTGTPTEDQSYATGSSPIGLAIGDVDGDGKADVVTADYGAAKLTLRLGLAPGPRVCAPSVTAPALVDFGSASQFTQTFYSVVLGNAGSSTLHLGTPQVDNPEFAIDPPAATSSVAPGGQTTVYMRDRRLSLGTANGTLTVETDDPDHPTLAIPLTGVSTAPAAIGFDASNLLPPPSLAFGDTTSRALVVSDGGTDSLRVFASIRGIGKAGDPVPPPGQVVALPADRLDAAGFLWNIATDGSIATGTDGAFSGGFDMLGYPARATAVLEDGNRTFDLGASSFGNGSMVRRKVFVSTTAGFARFFEIVANPTAVPIDYTVDVLTNMGGPVNEPIVTSNGDANFTTADRWVVLSDGDDVGRPAVAQVVDAVQPPSSITASPTGLFTRLRWNLSLPPGTATAVVHWAVQARTKAAATALAQQLALHQAGALDGLDAGELALLDSNQPKPAFEPIPEAFTVLPGVNRTIRIRYNATVNYDLPADVVGTLHLQSNDPLHPDTTLTVAMHVQGDGSTVDVPVSGPPRLALGALVPNPAPASARARLSYVLATDGAARIEAYDVRGRLLWKRALDRPAPGPGSVEIPRGNASGLVWFRLVQDGQERLSRAVLL